MGVAKDTFGTGGRVMSFVVGCAEVGLLPAPPGFKGAAGTAATEASAAWRGVEIDDVSFRAPDVPTVANVAVAPRARRYGAGRAIVETTSSLNGISFVGRPGFNSMRPSSQLPTRTLTGTP